MAYAMLDGPLRALFHARSRASMTDLTIVVLTLAMFATSALFLRLCERM